MNSLISVIIPVHNGGKYIDAALKSVFAQDYRPLEVIVADDASTDDTAAIVARYEEEVTLLSLDRCGVSAARNHAVRRSTGEWLAFLDADDIWLPGKLAAQIAAAGPSTGFVLCNKVCQFEGAIPGWFVGPEDGTASPAYEPSAWLVRRQTFDMVGPFDESRALGEDTEWLARAWDLQMQHVMLGEAYVTRRIHGSNASGKVSSQRRVVMDILRESVERKRARMVVE